MGNKMKKLLCSFLAAAMLVTSAGIAAFADADTATDEGDSDVTATETVTETTDAEATEAEATEAPAEEAATEATEAPAAEVTEAPAAAVPAASGTAYDSDAYYQKSLALCSALGIISGYEDGSVRPESKVTRAEMASIVLRMLGMSATSTYKDIFSDVTSAHWAANTIQSAYEAGIINGMGDGTFAPDSEVTYAQVIVMLVNAMNYKDDAEYYGGWQQGYIKEAGEIGLLKSAPGSADTASDRGVVIKMVYNALLGDYKEIRSYDEYGNPKYEVNKDHPSLAYAKFNVIDQKGIVYGTSITTIGTKDVQDDQVEIKPDKEDDSIVYDTVLTGLEEFLAQKVKYYYIERDGLTNEVVAVTYDSSKSETYVIEDLDDIEAVTGFENNAGQYKINKVSKAKDCSDATVVYNGKVVTAAALNDWLADNPGLTANDLYNPELGSVKLVNSEGTGDKYDFVFVDSYDTVIVSSASNDRLTGKVWDPTKGIAANATKAYSLKIDDVDDVTITVTKGGNEARLRNLKKEDVANVKRSLDDTVIEVNVAGETITGTASGITQKIDESHATVNGQRYDVANIVAGDLKTGQQSTFHLDTFGRIANIESSAAGQLQSGEKYGWLMSAYEAENGEDYLLQIMTSDGKAEEFTLNSGSIDYWGPKDAASSSVSSTTLQTTIANLIANNGFVASSTGVQLRLIKYKTNSKNAISKLYCAVDYNVVDDNNALRINPANLGGKGSNSGLVGGFQINDGILEISVPKDAADMKDADNYKFGTVNASQYVVRENGANFDFVVGEFSSSITPTLAVKFTNSSDAIEYIGDMDTTGNLPIMVVDDISSGLDDDDNRVYTISGYAGTQEVSVTTTKNTSIGVVNCGADGSGMAIGDKYDEKGNRVTGSRMYNHKKLWDAQNGFTANVTAKGTEPVMSDVLDKGDIIIYESTGGKILKLIDADDLYTLVSTGTNNGVMLGQKDNYNTRNIFYFQALAEHDLDDIAWIEQKNCTRISFDPSLLMDTIEININTGKVEFDKEGSEVTDLEDFYEEDKLGDYAFARMNDKGSLREIIIYRFVK